MTKTLLASGMKRWSNSNTSKSVKKSYKPQRKARGRPQDEDNTPLLDLLKTEEPGFLEAEGLEQTFNFTQTQLTESVSAQAAKKHFSLKLEDGGSYGIDYTQSGRNLLLAGRQGHVAVVEWETGKLKCELQLEENVRAAKWLHDETMFALAQANYVYIYDNTGAELHRLGKHTKVDFLDFLPYHYLLASIGTAGMLRYQDVTTGAIVAEHYTHSGRCRAIAQNPDNGILHLGNSGGCVTFWTPAMASPVVSMQCHFSPINAIAIDPQGLHMVTGGLDGSIKVWDLRTFKKLHEYRPVRPVTSLHISQRGLLAAGYGPHVTIWKDGLSRRSSKPYMHHSQPGATIDTVRFCPYDDVLGVGHNEGVTSLIIPGAGEPNYDSFEVNPFASRNQRREAQVKKLLDKLPPETIMLDPTTIGTVARSNDERHRLNAELRNSAQTNPGVRSFIKGRPGPRRNELERHRQQRQANIIKAEDAPRQEDIVINRAPVPPTPKTALDRFRIKSL